MADNFVSYNRFTALPNNIADYGSSVEELRALRGRPDKNPAVSPMAAPAVSQRELALNPTGSDTLRLAEPHEPGVDPYEGPRPVWVLSRLGTKKLKRGVLSDLLDVVEQLPDGDTKSLMLDSFARVNAMGELLGERNDMTENIYMRNLAANRS
jgi:hypothetical protein